MATVPPFDTFFTPFLELLAEGGPLHMSEVQSRLQAASGLSGDDLAKRLPSGGATVIENRIGWARTYLFKAGLIERVSWGSYRVSAAGQEMLKSHPNGISLADLKRIPAFQEWSRRSTDDRAGSRAEALSVAGELTSRESMDRGEAELRKVVEEELLARLQAMTPARFEWLVEQLIVRLGYGSSDDEVRRALAGGAGDGGVDGVIKEDRLGLGHIYLQAKRWQNTVGRPTLQAFVGAMHGRAQKGVFITTSDFSREALDYANGLQGTRLRLIDGRELASLMVECRLGVSEERLYRAYKVDTDFFDSED
jgi:restriction system protein